MLRNQGRALFVLQHSQQTDHMDRWAGQDTCIQGAGELKTIARTARCICRKVARQREMTKVTKRVRSQRQRARQLGTNAMRR